MAAGQVLHVLENAGAGLIHENVVVFAVLADELYQNIVIDIAVHSAQEDGPGIGNAADSSDRRLGDRGNRVIVVVDAVNIARKLHSVFEPGEGMKSLTDRVGITAKKPGADGIDKARIELVVVALEIHVKAHGIVIGDNGLLGGRLDRRDIIADEEVVARLLVQRDIGLGAEVLVHRAVVVEVLFVEV